MNFIVGLFLMAASVRAASNAVCNIEAGKKWTCTPSKACPNPELRLSHNCNSPHQVCCPPARKSRATKTAFEYCQEQMKQCNADMKNNYRNNLSEVYEPPVRHSIAGGVVSPAMEHPYMALIGYNTSDGPKWTCGGTLISERFVVSAAHCLNSSFGVPDLVRLGELDYEDEEDDAEPEDFRIIQTHLYPEYRYPILYHDLVLFKLDREVRFTPYKRPACLHTMKKVPYRMVMAAGWGRTGPTDDVSSILQHVNISLMTDKACNALRPKTTEEERVSSRTPDGVKAELSLCAGEKNGGRDTCLGDSGGPIIVSMSDKCLNTIVGVTSFGFSPLIGNCAEPNSTGVYVRISYYLPWIESILWP